MTLADAQQQRLLERLRQAALPPLDVWRLGVGLRPPLRRAAVD